MYVAAGLITINRCRKVFATRYQRNTDSSIIITRLPVPRDQNQPLLPHPGVPQDYVENGQLAHPVIREVPGGVLYLTSLKHHVHLAAAHHVKTSVNSAGETGHRVHSPPSHLAILP